MSAHDEQQWNERRPLLEDGHHQSSYGHRDDITPGRPDDANSTQSLRKTSDFGFQPTDVHRLRRQQSEPAFRQFRDHADRDESRPEQLASEYQSTHTDHHHPESHPHAVPGDAKSPVPRQPIMLPTTSHAVIDRHSLAPEAFYKMIGMRSPPDSSQPFLIPPVLEAGSGLYHDILTHHRRLRRRYALFETIIYAALLLQTLLATLFIVLGSMQSHHPNVTAALGALSATIAVVLALAKGQGLPNRLRMERDQMWEVQIEAEDLYWQVAGGRQLASGDVEAVWKRFIDIRKNAARNHPDTWNAVATSFG